MLNYNETDVAQELFKISEKAQTSGNLNNQDPTEGSSLQLGLQARCDDALDTEEKEIIDEYDTLKQHFMNKQR